MNNYTDNDCKFVAVLNKKIELPKLLNALGHISAGLISLVKDVSDVQFLVYKDGTGTEHPAISKFPFIVLKADNGNQIRTARNAAIAEGIVYNDFVDTMIGTSAENQLSQTINKQENELEYYAIVFFGHADKLNAITKKFSLFNVPSNPNGVNTTGKLMFH
ncbi:DUF2000 domain-containing protein [Mucilaginibacter psychrotolerans]|uniref:DUF2000 domain-containing protein n=1 Tax=Mucilaginibacter psychrotolerans TaxID=1524096 RepID=A0A4Y8SC49_9SPHI|nr:DUF2000 domain-containing protein [Mucilaginibacter psychrotolerans]TFF36167.1 DUF2000 domain-containing protein [Mucilaginibacter psychrotolerans]